MRLHANAPLGPKGRATMVRLEVGCPLPTRGRGRPRRSQHGAQGARQPNIRVAFEPLPVDEAVAERYGDLLAFARSAGRSAKVTDLLILATAATSERVLYTLDASQARLGRAAGVPVERI
jgi:predicted nucleic acid-binding protein